MKQRTWFERAFVLGTPVEALPELVERLRGTPARVEERVGALPADVLTRRLGEAWSIQEHVGHLGDLESLWFGRVEDLMTGKRELRAADLENTATWQADHNAAASADVLAALRDRRRDLVQRVESLPDAQHHVTARHPRLAQPMTVADLCFFVAEHDDHHLATITNTLHAIG